MVRQHPLSLLIMHFACRGALLGGMMVVGFFAAGTSQVLAESPAFVRVIHASPDVGTADVFVDGTLLLSSFQFGAVTDYASIPAGAHKVQIALVGKGIGAAVISETLTVAPGLAYTVAAEGTQPDNLSLQVFVDDNRLDAGSSKLRVYHLASDAGTLHVETSGNTVVQSLTYQEASKYVDIQPGAYTFDVVTGDGATHAIAASLSTNTVTSIFALGLLTGIPRFSLVSSQAAGFPGLPNTGSDPDPLLNTGTSAQSPLSLLWSLGCVSLLLIGMWAVTRRLVRKR